jgi:NAD(P)-dependent dehydrogenase (short-subunit alcohol dehydrogenase family)
MRLAEKFAVVMGVSEVIEQACAVRFAQEGATVAVVDPNRDIAEYLQGQIVARGGNAVAYSCDMADELAVQSIAQELNEGWGRVDVLVNTTGTVQWGGVETADIVLWTEVIRQGLVGPIICCKAFIPLLRRSTSASIINLGSIDGLLGNPQVTSYSIAKGGLTPLTHCLAEELGPSGIRVNMIARGGSRPLPPSPTGVATAFEKIKPPHFAQFLDKLIGETPLRRLADGEEFASVALFLATDEASYITGSIITVDGGRTGITPGTRPIVT